MDFLLDGKPHQVKEGDEERASFFDSPDPNYKWIFSGQLDKFEHVSAPKPKWSEGMRALIPSFEALEGQEAGLTEDMRPYCGQVGVVSSIGEKTCQVTFSDGDYWAYDLDRLLIPKDGEK
eukprot:RCo013071